MSQQQSNNPLSRQTLDQRRAKHAWEAVQKAKKSNDPKKFGGQARKLPMRIKASGLGNAIAFINAKGYAPELLEAISDWVLYQRQNRQSQKKSEKQNICNLLCEITKGTADFLRWATDETLAYLQWINRFAEAEGLTEETGQEE